MIRNVLEFLKLDKGKKHIDNKTQKVVSESSAL
jgi:hypothetical protein